jgi:hypothetical protein
LENLTERPVRLDLPSGHSVRISPRDTSPRLSSAEVRGSTMVDKLVRRGVLAVREEPRTVTPKAGRSKARQPEPAKSTTEGKP